MVRSRAVSQGISLVEVLISLLIFSVGMLGSGLMALQGLRVTRAGLYHTQALGLAQNLHESILAQGVPYELKNISPWQERIASVLPRGKGSVSQEPQMIQINIDWQAGEKKQVIHLQFAVPDYEPEKK